MTTDQQEPSAAADARPIPPEVLAAREAARHSLQRAKEAAWRAEAPNPIEAYDCAIRAVEQVLAGVAYPRAEPAWTLDKIIKRLRDNPDCWETRTDGVHSVRVFTDLLDDLWNAKLYYTRPDRYCEPVEDARDAVTIAEAVVALIQRDFLEWWGPITPPNHADDEEATEYTADELLKRFNAANSNHNDKAREFAISEEQFRDTFSDVFKRPLDESS